MHWFGSGQQNFSRAPRQRTHDEIRRDACHTAYLVDTRTGGRQHIETTTGTDTHSNALEQTERLFDNALTLTLSQPSELRPHGPPSDPGNGAKVHMILSAPSHLGG
jgi:hypothetical protein